MTNRIQLFLAILCFIVMFSAYMYYGNPSTIGLT